MLPTCQLSYSAGFNFNDSELSAHLLVGWCDADSHGTLELGNWLGAYLTLSRSVPPSLLISISRRSRSGWVRGSRYCSYRCDSRLSQSKLLLYNNVIVFRTAFFSLAY